MMRISCPLLVLMACTPQSATVHTAGAPPSVAIDATATLRVAPDTAAITLTFSDTGDTLAPAHRRVEAARAEFLSRLESRDVRVESGSFAYSPFRTRDGAREQYRASQTVVVHTTDLQLTPEIIDEAGPLLTSASVRNYVADMVQHRERVREMAIEAAGEKAAALADGFGVELGDPLEIEEGGASAHSWGIGNVDNRMASVSSSEDEPVAPGAIPLRLTLRVRYALIR